MVDWTILSPTFLRAVVEWAVTVVIVLAVSSGHSTKDPKAGVKNAAVRSIAGSTTPEGETGYARYSA
jgi:hypothetical protein